MIRKYFWICCLFLPLFACKGTDSAGNADVQSSESSQPNQVVATAAMVEAIPAAVIPNETTLTVDEENRLVYLDAEGWLDEDGFWDIYYNFPEKLQSGNDINV
jgi:hypothetical protein